MMRKILVLLVAGALGANAQVRTLQMPEVPASLVQLDERADYVAMHFWEAMDFDDPAMVNDSQLLEQAMVDFLSILQLTSDDAHKAEAFDLLLSHCNNDNGALTDISELAKKYLYETESPMLNEPMYEIYINSLLKSQAMSESERLRYEFILQQINRNRPGTKAPDMSLLTANGEMPLSAIMGGKPTILLMYDHDCDFCHATIDTMMDDSRLTDKTQADKLTVIAVDVNTDQPASDHKKQMPNWIWTSAIEDIDESLSIRSIPAVYVLGADMTVVIKDSSYTNVSAAIFH